MQPPELNVQHRFAAPWAARHLPRYLTEHDQKYNTRDVPDGDQMLATLQGAEGKRLTLYKSGIPGAESLRDRPLPSRKRGRRFEER